MTSIDVCPAEASPLDKTGSEIEVCSAADDDIPHHEIDVCPDERDTSCDDRNPLIISGPVAAAVDGQYGATGGKGPYTFSASGFTVDQYGKVTSTTTCGGPNDNPATGSITVTDACGESDSMDVRLPGGQWVYDSGQHYAPIPCCGVTQQGIECDYGTVKYNCTYCWVNTNNCSSSGNPCGELPDDIEGQPDYMGWVCYYCNKHVWECL